MQNNTFAFARGAALAAGIAFALGAAAQEVQQKPATTGGGVPKDVSVSQEALTKAGGQGTNWLHTNGSYDQQRFYPGNQINTQNVKNLRPEQPWRGDLRRQGVHGYARRQARGAGREDRQAPVGDADRRP
jgi:glucose dehydrogenase